MWSIPNVIHNFPLKYFFWWAENDLVISYGSSSSHCDHKKERTSRQTYILIWFNFTHHIVATYFPYVLGPGNQVQRGQPITKAISLNNKWWLEAKSSREATKHFTKYVVYTRKIFLSCWELHGHGTLFIWDCFSHK